MRAGIPIVLIHYGRSHVLDASVFQAYHTNPWSPIYLIGDSSNNCYPFAKHIDREHLAPEACAQFRARYSHHSVNTIEFERFCFERWILLDALMEQANLDRCFHIDSDVLLYSDVTAEHERFSEYDITLSHRTCAHVCYVNNHRTLRSFVQYINDFFDDRSPGSKLAEFVRKHEDPGMELNICDMLLLDNFAIEGKVAVGETGVVASNSIFDPTICAAQGFETDERGFKKIDFVSGVPYGRTPSGEVVRFCALHFQGAAKPFIYDYYTPARNWRLEEREQKRVTYQKRDSFVHQGFDPLLTVLSPIPIVGDEDVEILEEVYGTTPLRSRTQLLLMVDCNSKREAVDEILCRGEFHPASRVIVVTDDGEITSLVQLGTQALAPRVLLFPHYLQPEPGCFEAHMAQKRPYEILRGNTVLHISVNEPLLCSASKQLGGAFPYEEIDPSAMHGFHNLCWENISIPTAAFIAALRAVAALGISRESLLSELGYLLWCGGLRIFRCSSACAVDRRLRSLEELVHLSAEYGREAFKLSRRHPETATHHFGWHETTEADLRRVVETDSVESVFVQLYNFSVEILELGSNRSEDITLLADPAVVSRCLEQLFLTARLIGAAQQSLPPLRSANTIDNLSKAGGLL